MWYHIQTLIQTEFVTFIDVKISIFFKFLMWIARNDSLFFEIYSKSWYDLMWSDVIWCDLMWIIDGIFKTVMYTWYIHVLNTYLTLNISMCYTHDFNISHLSHQYTSLFIQPHWTSPLLFHPNWVNSEVFSQCQKG